MLHPSNASQSGDPARPLDFLIEEAELGADWSRRVNLSGTVESSLISFGRLQMILKKENRRFFVRARDYSSVKGPPVGSRIQLTGTLSYFTDENDQANVAIIHQMPRDQLDVQELLEAPVPTQYVSDFRLLTQRGSQSSAAAGPEQSRYEIHGQVSHIRTYEFVIVENKQGQSVTVYAPYQDDLHVGDVVRITAVRARRGTVEGQPLHPLHDMMGWTSDLIAHQVLVATTDAVQPPREYSAAEIVEQQSNRKRAVVVGKFQSIEKYGDVWRVTIGDQSGQVDCLIPDQIYDSEKLNLQRAEEIEASGVVYPPDGEYTRHFLRISQMKDIRVVRETPGIDYRLAAIIAGAVLVIATCSIVLLRLRSRRRERALQRLAARLESTQRAVGEGLLVIDAKGNFVESNLLLGKLLNLKSADLHRASGSLQSVGELLDSRFEGEGFLGFWKLANDSARVDEGRLIEQRELRTHGPCARVILIKTTPVLDTYGGIDARVWTFNDVSESKQLEANQLHAQKMQAVSQVVGGVAHDFNNMLMTISACLEMVKPQSGATDAQVEEYIADMHTACSLAADLARNLMVFSQSAELSRKPWDVNELVGQMCKLFASSLDRRVALHTSFASELRSCSLDRNYLIRSLLNICLNSRDALGGATGNIYISTATATYEDLLRSPTLFSPEVDPSSFIRIRIQDDGEGVPEELTEKIFEPFFTTKPEGKGTGIGLATSRKLIRQHGGDIQYIAASGEGACFDVYLPTTEQPLDSANFKEPGVTVGREY